MCVHLVLKSTWSSRHKPTPDKEYKLMTPNVASKNSSRTSLENLMMLILHPLFKELQHKGVLKKQKGKGKSIKRL